ncbi:MAG: SRPBCC family protein [Acidobacteriota bacterium]
MKVLKVLLLGLVSLVVVLVVLGLFLPSSAQVERSTVIEAPPATIFALVNNYQRFNDWSPWADRDPDAVYEYSGPPQGVGAQMAWSGGPAVGTGSQEITLSEPYERIETALDFGDQGTADAYFTFEPTGEGATQVVWGFGTEFGWNLASRYFGLVMDGMLGGDYEEGLANLKQLAESLPDADWTRLELERVEVEPQPVIQIGGSSAADATAVAAAYGQAFGTLMSTLGELEIEAAGSPLVFHTSWDETGYVFDAALPVAEPVELPADSPVSAGTVPGGPALRVVHVGPYEQLEDTYGLLDAYVEVHGLTVAGRPWDEFIDDPASTPADALRTLVYQPIESGG